MATSKPRITVTLTPSLYVTLTRLRELTGQPMAVFIVDILEAIHPPLDRTVTLLEAASQAPQQVKDGLRHTFEAVEREVSRGGFRVVCNTRN